MPEFDLSSFLNDNLTFTKVISTKYPKGKTYTAPCLPHRDKLALMNLAQLAAEHGETSKQYLAAAEKFFVDDKGKPVGMLERLIGAKVHAEMVADGVPTAAIAACESIAVANYTADSDAALAWLAAQTGKALAGPNRATRRAAARKSTPSPPKGGSSTTRQPASRSQGRSSSATPARTSGAASTSGRGTSARSSKAS